MKPGPVLSQKLGPLGMNMGDIISKINDATKDMKGLKVPVELDVNPTTKEFDVQVFSPPVSELLKKELVEQCKNTAQLNIEACEDFKYSDGENI